MNNNLMLIIVIQSQNKSIIHFRRGVFLSGINNISLNKNILLKSVPLKKTERRNYILGFFFVTVI